AGGSRRLRVPSCICSQPVQARPPASSNRTTASTGSNGRNWAAVRIWRFSLMVLAPLAHASVAETAGTPRALFESIHYLQPRAHDRQHQQLGDPVPRLDGE